MTTAPVSEGLNMSPSHSRSPSPVPLSHPVQTQVEPAVPPSSNTHADIFGHIRRYDFYSDQEYLQGLSTILGHPDTLPTPEELNANQNLVTQAQCFYFARMAGLSHPIDVEAYKSWLLEQPQSQPLPPSRIRYTNGSTSPDQAVEIPPSPIARPHAPTPASAAAATTLAVQPHQQIPSPNPPQSQAQAEPTPPYPTSFADIVDLITQNKPIPGIEEIPATVLELGSSKRDTATKRRKPWEIDGVVAGPESAAQNVGVDTHQSSGEGLIKILQPGAIPGNGLVANE